MQKEYKNLLIIESSSNVLSFSKEDDGTIIMEGVFGELGVKNRNGRVYEESEYLPQIEALQPKIKSKKLLGELDHPQNFDISLKNVSHVIEEISYDKETRQIRGKVRLLNTDAGKQAQALVQCGIPLHISSRAAGAVDSQGKVKIKKLFTYDLVAEPGFENAELSRVNESYGFENTDNLGIFEINAPIPGLDSDEEHDKYITNENKNNSEMEGSISREDFNKYSQHMAKTMNSLQEQIDNFKSTNESKENPRLVEYVNKLANKMNEMYSFLNYTKDGVNSLVDKFNQITEHNNHIVENIKDLKGYVDLVAEKSDQGIQYTEDVATKTNHLVGYVNEVSEHVDNLAQFSDELSEGINNLASYSDHLKEKIETVGQFGDYTAENVKKLKMRLSSINEDDTAEEIEKETMEMGKPEKHSEKEGASVVGEEKLEKVTESLLNDTATYKSEIASKLDSILESVQKQTTDMNGDLHFLRFLNSDEVNNFHALNESIKSKVIEKSKQHTYTSQSDVKAIIESVINPVDNTPLFLKNIPEEYRSSWNNASEGKKKQLIAESVAHSLNTDYQIKNFWSTRDFRESQMVMQKLNESNKNVNTNPISQNDSYMEWFKAEMNARFQK